MHLTLCKTNLQAIGQTATLQYIIYGSVAGNVPGEWILTIDASNGGFRIAICVQASHLIA